MTAREDFMRSEIEAMNSDARIANALAMFGPGMTEADYWNTPVRTASDQYVDVYGGTSTQMAGKFQNTDSLMRQQERARVTSHAWDLSHYTSDESIRIEIRGVATAAESLSADLSPTGRSDNAPLRMVGQSADGGLLWNTGAVSYPVGSPDIEVRTLQDRAVAGTGITPMGSTWQSDFMRGYSGEYRSVMEGPAPTSETVGRYSGEVVDSFRNFGMGMIGENSMNAAQASWNAGNYGTSLLQGAQAFGDAGTTVFGFGLGSGMRYGATMTAEELTAARGASSGAVVRIDSAAGGGTSTVYRVQGGVMPNASKTLITLDANGNPIIQNGTLNISIVNASHAKYFQTLRPNSTVTSFEIPSWMDDFIQENAIPQYRYNSNPLNQGRLAPKIVDPTTPGRSYELPSPWAQWLQENAVPKSGKLK